ncbi:MAG: hypothetical protein CMP67_05755 [Flavobacteriales bacterium]|nr:hypothetical protein [Flavobacteriales bacterium]|tara:strand:+ start:9439 stop:11343 length:1905 start_codon:yes stop_codon:yes gene_type:complete
MKKKLFLLSLTPFLFAYKLNAQITDTSANVYLNKVIDYANAMLEDGRDDSQYGADTCPMFAVYLRRETNSLPDFPTFRITGETFYDLDHPGGWAYRAFTNIPMMSKKNPDNGNHGQDKAHKQTVTGADPLENGGMYMTFEKLSAVTGDSKYNDAVNTALNWFSDKQSTTGLYPAGEHSGWDFRYDGPAYLNTLNSSIPYTWKSPDDAPLYHSWEHEPNGAYEKFVPFYSYLKENHPERFKSYCRGLWEKHFWDKENGYFNRHGDIYDNDGWGAHEDDFYGSFPRMARIFSEVWSDAYIAFPNDTNFQNDMISYLTKLIDGRILDRTNYDGVAIAFDRRNNGNKPQIPRQYLSMIHGIEDAANKIADDEPGLALKMQNFATQQWNWFFEWVKPENGYQGSDWASKYALGDIFSIQYAHTELHKPDEGLTNTALDSMYWYYADGLEDGSITVSDYNARTWATMIDYMIYAYKISDEDKYLNKAREFADWTINNYFDETSALPKCVSFGLDGVSTLSTSNGDTWEPPYDAQMGSADLMYSLLDLYATITGNDGVITSTLENKKEAIQIFPNPTEGFLTIQITQLSTIHIFDKSGRLVLKRTVDSSNPQVDLSNISSGIYTLEIIGENLNHFTQIVKK